MHRFQQQERQCTTFQAKKKVYFDLTDKCSSLHEPVRNGPEAVTLYITVTGQLPKIFSCLPQQRVAVVHRFDYVTINKRFRYISWNIYPWCKRLFLRVRRWPDWSVSADLLHARNKTSGLVVQTDNSAIHWIINRISIGKTNCVMHWIEVNLFLVT